MIGHGTLALLKHPSVREGLLAQPELATRAAEGLLRFDGPVEATTFRYARASIEMAGLRIARGDIVLGRSPLPIVTNGTSTRLMRLIST